MQQPATSSTLHIFWRSTEQQCWQPPEKRLAVPMITSATSSPVSAETSSAPTTALTTSTVFTPATFMAPSATSASTTAHSFAHKHQPADRTSFQMTANNPQNSYKIPTTITTPYLAQPIYATPTDHHQYPQHHQQTQSAATFSHNSRLPKIRKEKFDGDPVRWKFWSGLFQATVHNELISDAEKLIQLQSLTTRKANQSIAGFACNSVVYTTALQELQRRFGWPDIIVNNSSDDFEVFNRHQRNKRTHTWSLLLSLATLLKPSRLLDLQMTPTRRFMYSLQSTSYITMND